MSATGTAFIVLLVSLLNFNLTSSSPNGPCFVENFCQCIYPSGATLDLSKYHGNSTIYFPQGMLYFHPCKNAIIHEAGATVNECAPDPGVSVCFVTTEKNTTQSLNLGRVADATFKSTYQEDPVTVEFRTASWTTDILVDCAKDAGTNDSLTVTGYDTIAKKLSLQLKSNAVCIGFTTASSYGFFSTLFMISLISFTIYFVGGALLLKFLRGAEGLEMIPNYEFWKNFPQHCKGAFNSCLNKCQAATTYENI